MAKKKAVSRRRKKEKTNEGNHRVRIAFVTMNNEVFEGELEVSWALIEKHAGSDPMHDFLQTVTTLFGTFEFQEFDEHTTTMILKEIEHVEEQTIPPTIH